MTIDLAPTFLELAGGGWGKDGMDGQSLVPLLTAGSSQMPLGNWRGSFLTEYSGEGAPRIPGCPQYTNQGMGVSGTGPENSFTCQIETWMFNVNNQSTGRDV